MDPEVTVTVTQLKLLRIHAGAEESMEVVQLDELELSFPQPFHYITPARKRENTARERSFLGPISSSVMGLEPQFYDSAGG